MLNVLFGVIIPQFDQSLNSFIEFMIFYFILLLIASFIVMAIIINNIKIKEEVTENNMIDSNIINDNIKSNPICMFAKKEIPDDTEHHKNISELEEDETLTGYPI